MSVLVPSVLLPVFAAGGAVAFTHSTAVNYSSGGGGARALVSRNFDNLGGVDVAVVNEYSNTVRILSNPGSGALTLTGPAYPVGPNPVGIVAGRFNAGTDWDLAVTNADGASVTILFGGPGTTFTNGGTYPVGSSPRLLVVGDFNNDSRDDLAVANGNSNNVSVLLGSSSGIFTGAPGSPFTVLSSPTSTFQPHGITTGDFNGDGNLDVATANYASEVSVMLGSPSGALGAPTVYPAGPYPIAIAAAPLDGNSTIDLVVANNTTAATLTLLPGDGAGGFGGPQTISTVPTANPSDKPSSMTLANLGHNNGPLDLAVTMGAPSGNQVVMMCANPQNNTPPTGSFSPCNPAASHSPTVGSSPGSFPFGVVQANLNSAGSPDLAVADLNTSEVSVILSP